MSGRVIVEEYESLRGALRELQVLVYESGITLGVKWKRRSERLDFYVSGIERKRQRFYYEKPGVKRRRKRLAAARTRRRVQMMSGGYTPTKGGYRW